MERIERQRGDMFLVMLLIVLLGAGLSLLLSSSYSFSSRTYDDPLFLLKRQLLWTGLGCAAAFVASLTPPAVIQRGMPLILLGTILVLLLPFIPGLGVSILGARRWIYVFGLSFQPAELVKVSLVLYLASFFAKREPALRMTMNTLIPPFIVMCLFAGVILLQNDYSSAIFVLVVGLAMMYVARVPALHFVLVTLFTIPLGFLLLFTREHRIQRLLAFLDLSANSAGSGYQIITAKAAIVSGGLWGRGLGRGGAKLGPLPMSYSDFIYSVIGEETGLLGTLFVLALFALLAWRGYRIACRSTDRFSSLAAFGATTVICLQALLNMAVAIGLIPTSGITLPFFSAGGSSLFVTLVLCGLLVNLSRRVSDVQ
jgi:cell division protein FtsW